uniref:Uncharacterized protein n=1 Tax=Cacopsylla melanoneura TaxID=428564 RepID=A0A8D8U1C2_9HEMI
MGDGKIYKNKPRSACCRPLLYIIEYSLFRIRLNRGGGGSRTFHTNRFLIQTLQNLFYAKENAGKLFGSTWLQCLVDMISVQIEVLCITQCKLTYAQQCHYYGTEFYKYSSQ